MIRVDERTVELTELEQLFRELFELQLDQGRSLAEAVAVLAGGRIPPGLRSPSPILDGVLTPDFVEYLVAEQ